MSSEPPAATEQTSPLTQALRLHLDNRLPEAEAIYRQILAADPAQAQALAMLAMIVADRPGDPEAEPLLNRHLTLRPTDGASLHRLGRLRAGAGDDEAAVGLFRRAGQWLPGLAPIFNDLGVSLHRLGRRDEALAAFDQALALDPVYGMAHGNRGVTLFDLGRFTEALEAQRAALAYISPAAHSLRAGTLHNLSRAARKCGDHAVASAACAAVLSSDPTDPETVDELALLLEFLGRADESLALRNRAARRTGIRHGGNLGDARATLLLLGAVDAGHVPTRYLVDTTAFRTLSIGLLSPDQPDAPLGDIDIGDLAQADVLFNTLGEVDKQGGQFEAATALCARLAKPVLNPPHAVARTGRDQAQALFGDITGLVVPAVRWTDPAALAGLTIERPVLVRPPGDHGGENLRRLANDAERDAYLAEQPRGDQRLLLTDFHDFRSSDGHWRKYRMIFVDRQVFPYHLAIGDDWLVHYWRAEMAQSAWKKAEEERFLSDWRGVFGPVAAATIDQAARRLDLDYGGMDCALLPDGRALLFEANACILLHLDEPAAAFPYKHRYVPPIRDAFTQMVCDRVGRARV